MIEECILTKTILCHPTLIKTSDIRNQIKQTYENTYINDVFIVRVKGLLKVHPGRVVDNGVVFNVDFTCDIYKLDINDTTIVKVISSSGMGTYAYDELIGKNHALFYIPDSIGLDTNKEINVRVRDKRMVNGLTFLASLVE